MRHQGVVYLLELLVPERSREIDAEDLGAERAGERPDFESLEKTPLVSLVASRRQELFRNHPRFDERPHARGHLGLNPLYRPSAPTAMSDLNLRLVFPSTFYEQENMECKAYLPESVTVSSSLWDDIAQGRRTPEVQNLIAQCVLLDVPPRYGQIR
jgi:hypothetical protein